MNPVTVLYFGDLMTQLQIGQEKLRLPFSIKDVAGLMRLLASRGGVWQSAFGQPRATLRIMVNKREADLATTLGGGDEVAFVESISL